MKFLASAIIATIVFALELPAQEPTPTSIELPQSTICGTNAKGKVNLSGPVKSDPFEVEVTSSQPTTIDIRSPVTAARDATFAAFEVKCLQATQSMPVTITARNRGGSATATMQVLAPVLQTLSVQPHTGGDRVQGQVTLIGRAPTGGVVVALSSSSPGARVPQSVTVQSGQLSAPFTVTTNVVSQPTTVSILGTGMGISKTVDLVLQPPAPTSVTFHNFRGGELNTPGSVIGGSAAQIKVTLSGQPRQGQIVALTSSNPAAIAVPATVTFDGSSAEHSFDVTTGTVAQSATVNITATTGQTSTSGSLRVLAPAVEQVSVSPTIATGGQVVQLRIRLNGAAPATGFAGAIVTNNPAVVKVPPEFSVPAGAEEVIVRLQLLRIDEPAEATITAGAGGIKFNALLKVEPEGPTSISLQPTTLIGGAKASATVTRVSSPEPLTVLLSSNNAAVTVPTSVTFDPRSGSEQISITTDPVPSWTSVTITAKKGTVVRTASISLDPPAVTALTLSPSPIPHGQYVTAQFSINRPAPAGLIVRITVFDSAQPYNRDATIAVNSTTGSIRLGPFLTSERRNIQVTASTPSGSQSATAAVNPPPP